MAAFCSQPFLSFRSSSQGMLETWLTLDLKECLMAACEGLSCPPARSFYQDNHELFQADAVQVPSSSSSIFTAFVRIKLGHGRVPPCREQKS
jgi:hypothetical protein